MVGTVIDHHSGHLVPMQLKGTQLDPCCEPSTSSKWPIVLFSSGWAWHVEESWAKCSLRCFHIYTMYSTESPGSWDSRLYIWHVETSEQSFNLLGGSHLNSIIIVSVEHWYQPTNQPKPPGENRKAMGILLSWWARIWGSCEMYTQYLRDLASFGMVVISIEHEAMVWASFRDEFQKGRWVGDGVWWS